MTGPVEFEVFGIPAPQGSKRHVGNGVMVESSKSLRPWRDSLATAARNVAMDVGQFNVPVRLDVEFRHPMPRSRPKRYRDAGMVCKYTAPDLDKLLRAVGDGLQTGGLIRSDALICEVSAAKYEVTGWTGAVITITPLNVIEGTTQGDTQ